MNLQFAALLWEQRIFRFKYAFSILVMLVTFLASTGQALAQATSASVPPASGTPFKCVPVPQVQVPPTPKGASTAPPLQPVCPSGQVPQPVTATTAAVKPDKGIPPAGSTGQPLIASGYHYVNGYQYTTGIGAQGYLSQHGPYLSPSDHHTLAEIAGQSGDGKQIVEVGWTVDRGLNGDSNPHLFVFSWVNQVPNCYNGCGYVQYSSTLYPGMTVASNGSQHLYAIEYYAGNWWLYYDTQWIGYFPGSIWSNKGVTFTQVGLIQWFGEVSSGGGSNTQMGNGIFGSNSGSASVNSAAVITTPSSSVSASATLNATDPSCYNYGWITQRYSFRYGGPGC